MARPIHIKELLQRSINKIGLDQIKAAMACSIFCKIIKKNYPEEDNKILKKIRPIHLKNGVLTVATNSSILACELQIKQFGIIKEINKKLDRDAVRRIQFRIQA